MTDAIHGEIAGTTYSVKNEYNEKFHDNLLGQYPEAGLSGSGTQTRYRWSYAINPITIDSLQYVYATGTNKLTQVADHAPCPDMIQLPRDIDRDITEVSPIRRFG